MDQILVERFAALFAGNRSTYGVHAPEKKTTPGEKAKGSSWTEKAPVTIELYREHLTGVTSIGMVPIDENNNVRFCAIDVDVYPLNPQVYVHVINELKLPLYPFRSKSGGLHLYLFFSEDTKAKDAVPLVNQLRCILGLPENTEIFPKQMRLAKDGKGNWINLPYYNAEKTERYMYSPEGKRMDLESAVNSIYNGRVTKRQLETQLSVLPFASAPPCLQSLYLSGNASVQGHNRNVFLFNAATYLKARFGNEEFEGKLHSVNDSLDVPLPSQELDTTIVRSHKSNSYTYQCSDSTLKPFCDKTLCKLREFGLNSTSVSNFSFERLQQIMVTPPYYIWTVNGKEMAFYSEKALRDQDEFANLCMRLLYKVPNKLKQDKWYAILNTAFQEIEQVFPESDDLSSAGLLRSYLTEFLVERSVAVRPSQLTMGQVYKWKDRGVFVFRSSDLLRFLFNTKNFRTYGTTELFHTLKKDYNASAKKLYIEDIKNSLRVWMIPFEAMMDTPPTPSNPHPDPQGTIQDTLPSPPADNLDADGLLNFSHLDVDAEGSDGEPPKY